MITAFLITIGYRPVIRSGFMVRSFSLSYSFNAFNLWSRLNMAEPSCDYVNKYSRIPLIRTLVIRISLALRDCYFRCRTVNLDVGLLARSQYPEGPATGHLDTGFSWFPCVYKRMLRWFQSFQVATTCFSCSPPDLNFLVTFFYICVHVK